MFMTLWMALWSRFYKEPYYFFLGLRIIDSVLLISKRLEVLVGRRRLFCTRLSLATDELLDISCLWGCCCWTWILFWEILLGYYLLDNSTSSILFEDLLFCCTIEGVRWLKLLVDKLGCDNYLFILTIWFDCCERLVWPEERLYWYC